MKRVEPDPSHPYALIIWHEDGKTIAATHTFHPTREDAARSAPDDGTPFAIVDITREPWEDRPTINEIANRSGTTHVVFNHIALPGRQPRDY